MRSLGPKKDWAGGRDGRQCAAVITRFSPAPLNHDAASATSSDDTCCQHFDNHGLLLLTAIIYH